MAIWQYPKSSGQAEIIGELFDNPIENMYATLVIGKHIGDDDFFNIIEKKLKNKDYKGDARETLLIILQKWLLEPNLLNKYARPIIENKVNEQLLIAKEKLENNVLEEDIKFSL
jgi:hypothetical protein